MGKNQSASGLTNIIQYDTAGNISLVSGSTVLLRVSSSGAITTTGVISGSNALSASYAASASNALFAQTASYWSGSINNALSASYAASASNALSASNAVIAQTASYATAFTVGGTLTAQTLVVQTITSSVSTITGSTNFGSTGSNTHTFTGSVLVTGSIGLGSTSIKNTAAGRTVLDINGSSTSWINLDANNTSIAYIGANSTNGFINTDGAAYYLTLGTNGSEIMRITGSNVGIGTTNPSAKLDVSGSVTVSGSLSIYGDGAFINRLSSGEPYIFFKKDGVNRGSIYGVAGGGLRIFDNNDIQVLTITSSFVGIGTSSPSAILHVSSSATASTIFRVDTEIRNGALFVSSSGNVGIATTSPKVRLQVTPTLNAEAPVLGTANGIAIFTSANSNYGLQFNSTSDGTFHIQSQRFDGFSTAYNLVLNYAGGSVGIGTASINSNHKLEVSGALATTGINLGNMASLGSLGTGYLYLPYTGGIGFRSADGSAAKASITADNSSNLLLNSGGGSVGIGTSSPSAKLDIPGTSDGDQIISMGSNSVSGILNSVSNLYINADSDNSSSTGQIQFGVNRTAFTGGAALMTLLETGGRVGIGSVSPGFKLTVDDTANEWNTKLQATAGTETCITYLSHGAGHGMAIDSTINSSGLYMFKLAGGTGGGGNGSVEYMRVRGDGAMEMGTAGTRSYIRMGRFSNSLTNTGEAWMGRASDRNFGTMTIQLGGNSASSRNFEIVDYAWSVVLFNVGSNGNASLTGTLTQNASDIRLKENIQNIPNAIDKIKSINGVTFNWKKDGVFNTTRTTDVGVLAQEIQTILPDAVALAPFDTNHQTGESVSGENYLTVQYEKLVPLLIEGIKELNTKLDEANAKIAILEAK